MAIKRTGRVDSNIESIERALEGMLANLTTELEAVVSSGSVDKSKLEGILTKIDDQIINNASVRSYMLGDDPATQARVKNLIQEVQDAVKETIEEFRDSNKGKTLSDDQYKEVMGVYDAKVTGSATVTRAKVLDEFRTKADSISFASTGDKLSATTGELSSVEEKLAKIEGFNSQVKPGETVAQAIARLGAEIKGTTLSDSHINAIKAINENKYDYEAAVAALTVDGFSYKVSENVTKTTEFLNELSKLKDGNPEIAEIFNELNKVGISAKKGKFSLKGLTNAQKRKLIEVINNGLKTKKIDFSKAKENTQNELLDKATAEMQKVLGTDFIKLYPKEAKRWEEALKVGGPEIKIAAWNEMSKFLKEKDFELELEDMETLSKEEANLRTKKDGLEGKKKVLTNRAEGERLEAMQDELREIQVLGIDIKSGRDLVGLSKEDLDKASEKFYERKKAEFEEQFDKLADPKLKKIGFFEKLGYAITHRTLHPGQAIKAERVENWARNQIAATISSEAQKTAADKREKEIYYKMGALTPEQLKEFNDKQAELLAKHKKEQEEAILEGTTKTAADASKKAKEDTEVELGE